MRRPSASYLGEFAPFSTLKSHRNAIKKATRSPVKRSSSIQLPAVFTLHFLLKISATEGLIGQRIELKERFPCSPACTLLQGDHMIMNLH